jgi:mono/diheme cytochrome c family protein
LRFPILVIISLAIVSIMASSEAFIDPAYGSDGQIGKRIFERANCVVCHAGGGNMMDPGHPIKGAAFATKYSHDEVLEATIRKGFPEAGMPSQGFSQISALEMKDLIAYVRSFTAPSGRIQKVAPNNMKNAAEVRQRLPISSH